MAAALPPLPKLTPKAVALFERAMALRRRQGWSREVLALSSELDVELRQRPWSPDVLRCDSDTTDRDWPMGVEDYKRSRAIRLELEAMVRRAQEARKDEPIERNATGNGSAPGGTPPTPPAR